MSPTKRTRAQRVASRKKAETALEEDLEEATPGGVITEPVVEEEIPEPPSKPAPPVAGELKPGKKLPAGFANPDSGSPGHRCCDPQGRYQPTWSSVWIQKTDQVPTVQYFPAPAGKSYGVRTEMWVDVPPSIISNLEGCTVDVIEMDLAKANPLMEAGVTPVTRTVPRFQFSVRPSA